MSNTDALRLANNAAWDGYRSLLTAYPGNRTQAQEHALQRAHAYAESTRDALERAAFWDQQETRIRA